ncbi:hypothetical protein Tco_0033215 [Tanacetum coccineum]
MDSQAGSTLQMGDRRLSRRQEWMVEEEAYASREAWAHSIGLSQRSSGASDPSDHVHETQFQMQQAELAALRETDRRRQAQMAELLALREQQRRARQPGPEVRIPDHQDASEILTVTSSDLKLF